jgi:hypothetical protein
LNRVVKYLTAYFFASTSFVVVVLGFIIWKGIETKKYKCEGEIIDRVSSHRSFAEASFIFEKYAKFMFWADRSGRIHFDPHGPEAFRIYDVYQLTDYIFWLSEIGERSAKGRWSTISNSLAVKINESRSFEGYCRLSM